MEEKVNIYSYFYIWICFIYVLQKFPGSSITSRLFMTLFDPSFIKIYYLFPKSIFKQIWTIIGIQQLINQYNH